MSHRTLLFGFRLHHRLLPPHLITRAFFSATVHPLATDAEITTARQWLKTFNHSAIPQSVGDVSYSRSSGPGGQNVNKCVT